MTGNETEDGKKDDSYDLKYYERTGGKESDELKQQVEDVRREVGKFSMVTSVCLLILGVAILVLLGVGVTMIVKSKSNVNDEYNGQGAVGEKTNSERKSTTVN